MMVEPLAVTTSDQVSYVISFQTTIPKAKGFRFENITLVPKKEDVASLNDY
jgi:hypothetical protein